MDEAFDTPALRVLRHIARSGPVKMREFAFVSRSSAKVAKRLREKLLEDGFLVCGESTRPVSTDMEIDLTPMGRKLAEMNLAQEQFLERAHRKPDRRGA